MELAGIVGLLIPLYIEFVKTHKLRCFLGKNQKFVPKLSAKQFPQRKRQLYKMLISFSPVSIITFFNNTGLI